MRRRFYLFIEGLLRLLAAAGGLWILLLLAVISPWASLHMMRWWTFFLIDGSATLCLLVGAATVAFQRRIVVVSNFCGACAVAGLGLAFLLSEGNHSSASFLFAAIFFALTVSIPLGVVAFCVYDFRHLPTAAETNLAGIGSESAQAAGKRISVFKRRLITCGACVLLFSLLVAGIFEASVKTSSMDKLTLRMPLFWRKAISDAVYENDFHHDPASHEAMERVVQLYPANTDGWKRRCLWAGSSGDLREDVQICEKAVAAEPSSPLIMSAFGRTQLAFGDACAAQKSYKKAVSLDDNPTHYADLEYMARAALRCGDLGQARAGLEAAIKIEETNRAGQRMYSGQDDDVARRDEEEDKRFLTSLQVKPKQN